MCHCHASFTRRDLLTRHWRITGHSSPGVADTEHVHVTPATLHENIPPSGSVINVVPEDGMLEHTDQHQRPDLPTPVASFDDAQAHVDPALHHDAHDEGLQDFRDFVNFIDGVGLSAQWTPEYNMDWMRLDHYPQESRRPSRELETPHSPSQEDIGTPFSTWLPSAPADDQVHLRSHSADGGWP